jgi:hypothetical protein
MDRIVALCKPPEQMRPSVGAAESLIDFLIDEEFLRMRAVGLVDDQVFESGSPGECG